MQARFPLFSTPIDLAHHYWKLLLLPTDTVVDATCGNGKDSLFLARLIPEGILIALDVQQTALDKAYQYLAENLSSEQLTRIKLLLQSHASFPPLARVKLIVYNLGYLPGGNKEITTQTATTLSSLQAALTLLAPGGAVSLTCYPGHPEGKREEEALLEVVKTLPSAEWNICYHQWTNRSTSPSLLFIQKQFIQS